MRAIVVRPTRTRAWQLSLILAVALGVFVFSEGNVFAGTPADVLAKRLASRIAGTVPASVLAQMTSSIQAGDYAGAAHAATATAGYTDTFLYNLFSPICNLAQTIPTTGGQTPCIATAMFIAITGRPWTEAITGNYQAYFTGTFGGTAIPTPTSGSNANYDTATSLFQQGKLSYAAALAPSPTPQSITAQNVMGLLTLASVGIAGQLAYDAANAGTDRRFVEILFQNFLGLTLTAVRDPSFATSPGVSLVNLDVFRMAADPATLNNTCLTCHVGIAGMERAFQMFDMPANQLVEVTGGIAQKILGRECVNGQYNANGTYPTFCKTGLDNTSAGYRQSNNTNPNAWTIEWTKSPYGTFNWGSTTGTGANSLGVSVANTLEYRINVVNQIYQLACGQAPPSTETEKQTIISLAKYMQTTAQDKVTPMVEQIATLPECLGR